MLHVCKHVPWRAQLKRPTTGFSKKNQNVIYDVVIDVNKKTVVVQLEVIIMLLRCCDNSIKSGDMTSIIIIIMHSAE